MNLECYDINNNRKFIIIKYLHKKDFNSCRYFYDELGLKDLIITASLDCHVKVIYFLEENSKILFDLSFDSNNRKIINTAYCLNQHILVPFSNINNGKVDFYEINSYYPSAKHSFAGCIRENAGFILGLSYFIYNSKYKKKNYVLIANSEGIFAYYIDNWKIPELHHRFIPKMSTEEQRNNGFGEAYVIEKDEIKILIGPSFYYGYLFFWDFFSFDLLYKMTLDSGISDICLWDNNFIFASLNHSTSQFVLINLNSHQIEKHFKANDEDSRGCGIKVLKNKINGNFLISFSINGKLDLYTYWFL